MMGAAVQSHWFSTGSVVPWARPGARAVCAQSLTGHYMASGGLDLMQTGRTAKGALDPLTAADEGRDFQAGRHGRRPGQC